MHADLTPDVSETARFCPRLRDLPERKLACIAPSATHPDLQPLLGQGIKTDLIREHWGETIRLVASLKAGIVEPSAMLRKLAASAARTNSTWRRRSWDGSPAGLRRRGGLPCDPAPAPGEIWSRAA